MAFPLLLAQNAGDIAAWAGGAMMLWFLLALAGMVLWVWALVHAIQNPALDNTMRIVWVLVILFTSVLGAIIYLTLGRSTPRQWTG
jgi:hypothetical protein